MSRWRERYQVHPAADVFPMMSDDELAKLGEDIRANELHNCIVLWVYDTAEGNEFILDGRNRLEAMERAGIAVVDDDFVYESSDPATYVISANIHRRHLTKQQQADLIVAAIKAAEASRQVGEVPERHVKGKAGSEKDPIKEAAVKAGAEHGIGKRTVERAMAKAEGRKPKTHTAAPPTTVTLPGNIKAARLHYASLVAALPVKEQGAEMKLLGDAINKAIGDG